MNSLRTIFNALKQALNKKADTEYVDEKVSKVPKPDVTKKYVDRKVSNLSQDIDKDLESMQGSMSNLRYTVDGHTTGINEIWSAINTINSFDIQVVYGGLPIPGENNHLYLTPSDDSSSSTNTFDEYVWIAGDNRYEKVGSTNVDMSDYPTVSQMNGAIQDAIGDALEEVY